jgi:hypothetical protein
MERKERRRGGAEEGGGEERRRGGAVEEKERGGKERAREEAGWGARRFDGSRTGGRRTMGVWACARVFGHVGVCVHDVAGTRTPHWTDGPGGGGGGLDGAEEGLLLDRGCGGRWTVWEDRFGVIWRIGWRRQGGRWRFWTFREWVCPAVQQRMCGRKAEQLRKAVEDEQGGVKRGAWQVVLWCSTRADGGDDPAARVQHQSNTRLRSRLLLACWIQHDRSIWRDGACNSSGLSAHWHPSVHQCADCCIHRRCEKRAIVINNLQADFDGTHRILGANNDRFECATDNCFVFFMQALSRWQRKIYNKNTFITESLMSFCFCWAKNPSVHTCFIKIKPSRTCKEQFIAVNTSTNA